MGDLRKLATGHDWEKMPNDVRIAMLSADSEIERLRAVLTKISDGETDALSADPMRWPCTVAFISLGGKIKDGRRVYTVNSKESSKGD